ncbi:cordon-bleu protein-like 1 [Oncorhynchus tshawytscha]|uniref:cordon-bleu protein-like 1 n=1 Tax=Oncorhynchus tshawytscha TaxID=74940 RepID=UPI001C3D7C39|nr:cordon-bleu protein-like 1 [Oncorhynchus tshawytscha]
MEEYLLEREHALAVVLPGGLEKTAQIHGSKPVMDILVTLCALNHLNPSEFTIELQKPNLLQSQLSDWSHGASQDPTET